MTDIIRPSELCISSIIIESLHYTCTVMLMCIIFAYVGILHRCSGQVRVNLWWGDLLVKHLVIYVDCCVARNKHTSSLWVLSVKWRSSSIIVRWSLR